MGRPKRLPEDRVIHFKPRKPKGEIQYRPCIRCRESFLSEHVGNRMCAECKLIVSGYVGAVGRRLESP